MTTTAPTAQAEHPDDLWHIDFHLSYQPNALQPDYIRCEISRRTGDPEDKNWSHEGVTSFDAPHVTLPREGQDTIPYMLYHLDQIKAWLMEEHVRAIWNDTQPKIGPEVGLPRPKPPNLTVA